MKKLLILVIVVALGFFGFQYFNQGESLTTTYDLTEKHPKQRVQDEIREIDVKIGKDTIYGEAYIPASPQGTLPLVILSHGFGGNYKNLIPIAKELMAKGIASYTFDYRGGAPQNKSSGTMRNMSVLTEKTDLNAVIKKMKTLDFVNNNKIYLAGHSQGGLVSALVAAQRTDIQGLFLAAPAFNIPDYVKVIAPPKKGRTYKLWNNEVGRKYITDARTISMYDDVIDFHKRVLIFHGGSDLIVPIQYSADAVKEYDDAKLYSYEDADHKFNNEIMKEIADKAYNYIHNGQ